jgi:hypothetical protein
MAISLIETASLDTGLVAPTATALTTASGSAPSYSARAWVNFNGTGTVAIRGSGNVTSITDNGTGDYTVNFTTAMADANYSVNTTSRRSSSTDIQGIATVYPNVTYGNAIATTFVRVVTGNTSNGVFADFDFVAVSVFR